MYPNTLIGNRLNYTYTVPYIPITVISYYLFTNFCREGKILMDVQTKLIYWKAFRCLELAISGDPVKWVPKVQMFVMDFHFHLFISGIFGGVVRASNLVEMSFKTNSKTMTWHMLPYQAIIKELTKTYIW